MNGATKKIKSALHDRLAVFFAAALSYFIIGLLTASRKLFRTFIFGGGRRPAAERFMPNGRLNLYPIKSKSWQRMKLKMLHLMVLASMAAFV